MHVEELLELGVDRQVVGERVACRAGREVACELAKAVGAHRGAETRRGAIERQQRVARVDEQRIARVGEDGAQLAPGFDEERAHRITGRSARRRKDGGSVAAVEEQGEEALAQFEVVVVARDLLDDTREDASQGCSALSSASSSRLGDRAAGADRALAPVATDASQASGISTAIGTTMWFALDPRLEAARSRGWVPQFAIPTAGRCAKRRGRN